MSDRQDEVSSSIMAFRASPDLVAAIEAAAAAEGLSKADITRRATRRDLVRYGWLPGR